ncbi:MAG TPA: hypothetical protein VFG74_04670 [Miltoncostaeaceae bacterium]|nr:hypothetical protein [Miltoncostaeaceae bacterium]
MGMKDWDWSEKDADRPDWDRLWVGLRDGAFLGPEDGVRKRGLVSINTGWLARGGLLRLYHDRIEFEPNPLERLMLARRRVVAFADVARLERRPTSPDDVSADGQAPRLRIHRHEGDAIDVLPAGRTLDEWIAAIRESMTWWSRRGPVQEGPEGG